MLDFVNPHIARRRPGSGGEARLDGSGWEGTLTQHAVFSDARMRVGKNSRRPLAGPGV